MSVVVVLLLFAVVWTVAGLVASPSWDDVGGRGDE